MKFSFSSKVGMTWYQEKKTLNQKKREKKPRFPKLHDGCHKTFSHKKAASTFAIDISTDIEMIISPSLSSSMRQDQRNCQTQCMCDLWAGGRAVYETSRAEPSLGLFGLGSTKIWVARARDEQKILARARLVNFQTSSSSARWAHEMPCHVIAW